ncbi:MAG TPA: TetR/AcrR family transcriptional regulator [Streptosporangiaceae bacterium]
MSHREQLLSAARRCLEQRGYARTTARDLVAESGTNLASIGYHFGSKEALLNQAMMDAFAEYADKLIAVAEVSADAADPLGGLRRSWIVMVEEFANMRPLLVAFIEAMAQAERHPQVRAELAGGYERLRAAIAANVTGDGVTGDGVTGDGAESIASFLIAVSDGLMVQFLLDPERAPDGAQAFDAASMIFGS